MENKDVFILRTIHYSKKGGYFDNYSFYEKLDELVDSLAEIDPDDFQAYEARDISLKAYSNVIRREEEVEFKKKKEQYEKLKKEFGE